MLSPPSSLDADVNTAPCCQIDAAYGRLSHQLCQPAAPCSRLSCRRSRCWSLMQTVTRCAALRATGTSRRSGRLHPAQRTPTTSSPCTMTVRLHSASGLGVCTGPHALCQQKAHSVVANPRLCATVPAPAVDSLSSCKQIEQASSSKCACALSWWGSAHMGFKQSPPIRCCVQRM